MSGATRARVLAPAKLTWSLRVGPRRADGLHELDSEMITLDLADTLEIIEPGGGIEIEAAPTVRAGSMSLGQENLISKALRLCGRRAGVQMNKVIPLGGGLGGGSADAAAILRWAAYDKLAGAASLGSDVPFCVVGGRARVTGVGDIVEPLAFEPRTLVLCIPPIHCDTGAVYRALDQLRSEGKRHAERNDLLEGAVLAEPMLAGWLDELKALTGVEPHLAGSGSTLFVEGSKEDLGFSGVDRVEHRGQWAELIEARSVPSSYGAPQAL